MLNVALTGLENAMNTYLRLDSDTIQRLAELDGKVIKIHLTDWNIEFYCRPSQNGLSLSSDKPDHVDTTIEGTLVALLKISQTGASSKSMFDNKIDFHGDIDTGEKLQQILRKMDIDWEEHLSKVTGDSAAHHIMHRLQQGVELIKNTLGSLQRNVTDYVQQEAQLFPTQDQVERFYDSVSTLRDDVDRLEARIKRLQNRNEK